MTELSRENQRVVKGGEDIGQNWCSCTCQYAGSGGSSIDDNVFANAYNRIRVENPKVKIPVCTA